jgi:hypothetical protein
MAAERIGKLGSHIASQFAFFFSKMETDFFSDIRIDILTEPLMASLATLSH